MGTSCTSRKREILKKGVRGDGCLEGKCSDKAEEVKNEGLLLSKVI